jgi:hypothetical protein
MNQMWPIRLGLIVVAGCDLVFPLSGPDARTIDTAADSSSPDTTDGVVLLAHYPMDGVAAGRVEDTTGQRHASCDVATGTCPTLIGGKIGGALRFDGSNHMLSVASDPGFDAMATAFTITTWLVRLPGSSDDRRCIVTKELNTSASWSLCLVDGQLAFGITTQAGFRETIGATQIPRDLTFRHIAVVWDGTQRTIYLGGERDTREADTGRVRFDGGPVTIGATRDREHLLGVLDDLRIYAGALSAAEIAELAK